MSNDGNNLHDELEKAKSELIKLREMNQEIENRVDSARDKIAVLQALLYGLKDMGLDSDDHYDKLISVPFFFGLDEIIRDIKYDLSSAINGGYPCELEEYKVEDLEREIASRKNASREKAFTKETPEASDE